MVRVKGFEPPRDAQKIAFYQVRRDFTLFCGTAFSPCERLISWLIVIGSVIGKAARRGVWECVRLEEGGTPRRGTAGSYFFAAIFATCSAILATCSDSLSMLSCAASCFAAIHESRSMGVTPSLPRPL